jgi:hypothetical protein
LQQYDKKGRPLKTPKEDEFESPAPAKKKRQTKQQTKDDENMAEDWADINSDSDGSQKPAKKKRGRGSVSNLASEDQKTRRLEKNRQSAKESRLRKKNYM